MNGWIKGHPNNVFDHIWLTPIITGNISFYKLERNECNLMYIELRDIYFIYMHGGISLRAFQN